MKILNEKVKIGEYRGMPVFVDWRYLNQDRGRKKEEDELQFALGRSLFLIGTIGLVLLFLYELTLGNFLLLDMFLVKTFTGGLSWILVLMLIYSAYLRRDRSEFVDTLDLHALTELRGKLASQRNDEKPKIIDIEVLDFVDTDVLNILDDIIVNSDESIYQNVMLLLMNLPDVKQLFERLGVDLEELRKKVIGVNINSEGDKTFQINKMLYKSFVLAESYNFSFIGEWVIFLELAMDEFALVFRELGIQKETLMAVLEWTKANAISNRYKKMWKYKASLKPKNTVNRSYTSTFTSNLNQYSVDLTVDMAKDQSEMAYAVSREKEIEQVVSFLGQADKAAVMLVGEAGVGKTTILRSIAAKMVVEDVPDRLKDKRLVVFDFNKAINSVRETSALRDLFAKIFEEVERSKNVILVIDDLDNLMNVKNIVAGEIMALITKALEERNIKLIATTTSGGFIRSIKPNENFVNLFDIVQINEPTPEVALQILFDERSHVEKKYGVKIQFAAFRAAIDLTVRYDTTRLLPFKALDVLEDACVLANGEKVKYVGAKEVESVVSRDIGLKVGGLGSSEREKLIRLEELMHGRIVGQDVAIKEVADALKRVRAGLAGENKPIASFLFFGPTGVGKTELARTLAALYFGNEKLLTRLDMSEFQEDSNVKRLIGYVDEGGSNGVGSGSGGGSFVPGQLTEKVRQNPFSLVLLDEIEKANPAVLDLFLQVLDEGRINDGMGRKVDFKNTIVIATSNVGSGEIAAALGSGRTHEDAHRIALVELKKHFRIEFLNRFDKLIMFKPLSRVEIEKVCDLMLQKVVKKLADQGIALSFSPEFVRGLALKGYSPVYGAREMQRVIQDEVEDKLADKIVRGELKSGDSIRM